MELGQTLYVKDRKSWRAWLVKNHWTKKDIWLVYYRKETGKPRIPYNDAVEEALCYGWIDSIIKHLDCERFVQRFSPRRKTSGLSQANKERVRHLIARHKMTRAGLDALAHVFDPAKDKPRRFTIPEDILKPLRKNKQAWRNFRGLPAGYRRIRIAYIESRRRQGREAFRRSLLNFIKMTAQNKRFGLIKESR
ncbi:MAG: YdeI/OmpD-associated family protein [Candidatus Brocadiia bacterium]